MNFVSGEAVAYAMLQFLWSQGTKDWGWKRAVECLLHHWIADSEGTWLCKDILFLFVPSRPFVNTDGPDPSPRCAKMTNTVCPATPVFYTWPSVFLCPQIFLSPSSKSCIWHGAALPEEDSFHRQTQNCHLSPSQNYLNDWGAFITSFSTKRIISEAPWQCYILFFLHYLSVIWFLSLLMASSLGWELPFWSHETSAAVVSSVWTTCHGN